MKPLLSIVIPTKNRYKYLFNLLELIDSFQLDSLEVVIQDNSEDNTPIRDYFSKYKKADYIIYNHHKDQLPIYLNSDYAILNSSGEYVCFIGDDDGVTPYIVECVRWMKAKDINIVVPQAIMYQWPDFISNIKNERGGLYYKKFTGEAKKVDCAFALSEIMKQGFKDKGLLPVVYQGIVKRSLLDAIYQKCETFFPGASPDIANGVALSIVSQTYISLSFPIIISGASASHSGGVRALKGRVADIDSLPFLPSDAKLKWEPKIPKMWSGPTISAESAIKALRRMGREDLIENVDFEYLYTWLLAYRPVMSSMVYKLTKHPVKIRFKALYLLFKRVIDYIERCFISRVGIKMHKERIVCADVKNICEAVNRIISENGYSDTSFSQIVMKNE